AGATRTWTWGNVRFAGGGATTTAAGSSPARVELTDCAGNVPFGVNTFPRSDGRISIGAVTANGKSVAPMTGAAAYDDGVFAIDAALPIAEGASLFPAAQGVEINGDFAVHARFGKSNHQLTLAA